MNRLPFSLRTFIQESIVFLLVATLLFNPLTALRVRGQTTFTVTGTVTTPGGGRLANVVVTEKGTANKVTSDKEGFYEIKVKDGNAILNFWHHLGWNEDVPVNSTNTINRSLKCTTGTWVGNTCVTNGVPMADVNIGCPTPGMQFDWGSNKCLPIVKFHYALGTTLDSAQNTAAQNGWLLATPDELYSAWRDLKLEEGSYGMLYDGQLAFPMQKDVPPAWRRGANIGIPGKTVQGFFYIQKEAASRAQAKPPTTACSYKPINPMLDGWNTQDPILMAAARAVFQKEGKPTDASQIVALATQLRSDPVRRWQFAPFMLGEMWKAIASPNPNPAQDQFRRKFEAWAACDEKQIAEQTLAMWNAHIGKSYTTEPREVCSGQLIWVTSLNGRDRMQVEEPCQLVSIHWMNQRITGYKYNTLGVLMDTKTSVYGGKWTVEGFLPLNNPQFFGYNGREAMKILLKPMMVKNMPGVSDTQNLRALGTDLDRVMKEIGLNAAGVGVVASVVGTTVLANSIRVASNVAVSESSVAAAQASEKLAELVAMKLQLAEMTGTKLTYQAAQAAARVDLAAAQAASKTVAAAKEVGMGMLKELMGEGSEAAAKKAAQQIGQKLATQLGTKIATAIAVIGIIATFGEILGRVLADSIKTAQFDEQVNRAAKELLPYNVKEILGSDPSPELKAIVFTKLLKMAISDPADNNLLSLALPPLDCPSGTIQSPMRRCVAEVKFHSQGDLTLEQAREIANTNSWQLANEEEVQNAWLDLGLSVYAFGRMDDGRFAVPVQQDYPNFKAGPNIDAKGGNQGFFYTVGKSLPPPDVGYVRFQNRESRTMYINNQVNQLEYKTVLSNWHSAQWKLVPAHSGLVRIQNRWYPNIYLNLGGDGKLQAAEIQPNWQSALWTLIPDKTKGGAVRIQNSWYPDKYIHSQGGTLQIGPIQPDWDSALWIVQGLEQAGGPTGVRPN